MEDPKGDDFQVLLIGNSRDEIFVERRIRYRTSHHNNILGTPKKISCKERRKRERGRKDEKKEKEGGRKKKEEEKGGERKKGGKSLFLQGLYILSTYIVLF